MRYLLRFAAFVVTAYLASAAVSPYRGRIVGGDTVLIEDYPYQISIAMVDFGHFCGGSIYNANTIITAAHCVNGHSKEDLFIRAGTNLRKEGGRIIKIDKIIVSKLWNEQTVNGDIAILILKEKLQFSDKIKPIQLATEDPKDGQLAQISGWGLLSHNDVSEEGELNLPEKLQAVAVPIFNWQTCNELLNNKLTENMFCAGFEAGGKDSCQMDSGGPLVINNKLYGVISWGQDCASPSSPGVYTKVKNFVDWIKNVSE